MADLEITRSAQAYKGESVICSFAGSSWTSIVLANPEIYNFGKIVSISSNSKLGIISEIDIYGNSFKVTPLQPDFRFDSVNTPGILRKGEVIQAYLPS